jgi:hypothetical protein
VSNAPISTLEFIKLAKNDHLRRFGTILPISTIFKTTSNAPNSTFVYLVYITSKRRFQLSSKPLQNTLFHQFVYLVYITSKRRFQLSSKPRQMLPIQHSSIESRFHHFFKTTSNAPNSTFVY